jgi:uncharacterized membrane protein HdeD (DUF308 family)
VQQLKSVASEYKPWRKDLPWYWVGLQGAIALAIGIYFVATPDAASSTIRALLAILLIVSSVSDILNGFRDYANKLEDLPMTPYFLVRGGAGVAVGLLFFLSARSDYLTETDARYILGYGLIAYAAIGLVGAIMAMVKGQMHWMAVATNLLYLLLGAVLIYNNQESVEAERAVRFLGWAAIIGGAILLVYTYFLKTGQEAEAALALDAGAGGMPATVPGTGIPGGPPLAGMAGAAGTSLVASESVPDETAEQEPTTELSNDASDSPVSS